MSDLFEFFLALVVLGAFVFFFIRISMRIRKGGGSILSVTSGATDAFYNRDKKEAIRMIVEKNAHKKMDEQSSSKKNPSL